MKRHWSRCVGFGLAIVMVIAGLAVSPGGGLRCYLADGYGVGRWP